MPHVEPVTRSDSSVTLLALMSMPTTVPPDNCNTGRAPGVFDKIVIALDIVRVPDRVYGPAFNARVEPGVAESTAACRFAPGLRTTVCPYIGVRPAKQLNQSA